VERVNLQAIPHDYRLEGFEALEGLPTPRALIASAVAKDMPGWSVWELDLAQAELRVAAMWAKCERMLDAIRDGRDLHGETASELFGVQPGEPGWGFFRQVGKRGNFTLCFGAGPRTFRAMVAKETGKVYTLGESAYIVDGWNDLYPEYRRTIRKHSNRVESRIGAHGYGWVTLANGAKRWWHPSEGTHKAFNQRVQGSLAQYAVDWMNKTEQHLGATNIQKRADADGIGGAGLLLVIHDSQVLLLPDDVGEALAGNCKILGKQLWESWFPDVPGDIDIKQWKAA
jgi:DNA polymerase I-like protein with 3'-5' exonuclease and polymerase domains